MRRSRWLMALSVIALAPASRARAEAPGVRAPAGALRGTGESAAAGVEAFLGIPYAAAPVGALRWREPRPAARWRGVRDATGFAPRCLQQPIYGDMRFRSPAAGEDCLYLNIWRPAHTRRGARLPVLVYIHGGGFLAGDGSERRYDGAAIAAAGAVVVTLNYRLGIFGFFAHPELTAESPHHASGDQGLLDQAAAIGWVRRNIAAFGGDPRHVTIGGESAGSLSVSALMASPLTRDAIVGAIGESGAIMAPTFQPAALAQAEADGRRFAESIGGTSLAALRAMPADALLEAQGKAGWRAGAVIDGYFLRESPTDAFAAGRQAQVPLLVGANSQEDSAAGLLGDQPATVAGYRAALAREFGAAAAPIAALYPAASDGDVPAAAMALASDRFLAQATWHWFDAQRRAGVPVYDYLYTRVRPPAPGDPSPPPLGAVHSGEIEYALGNLDTDRVYRWSADDRRVSATMKGYWVNFVRTGDPNGPGLPRWPAARAGAAPERQVIDVDTHAEPVPDQARHIAMERLLPPR